MEKLIITLKTKIYDLLKAHQEPEESLSLEYKHWLEKDQRLNTGCFLHLKSFITAI